MMSDIDFDVIYVRPGRRTREMDLMLQESTKEEFLGQFVNDRLNEDIVFFTSNGELAGYAIPRMTDGVWRVGPIYTSPKFRGKGVGRWFVREFFKGRKGLAWIEPNNIPSQKTFSSAGFYKTGEEHVGSTGIVYDIWSNVKEGSSLSW